MDSNYQIKGISILSNTETPGLGTRITEISFTDQFKGLGLEDISLSKDGGKIDAITGATISSRAVTNAVRDEIEKKIETIKKNK
ncbi:MAG: FMN-binding protein [Actinobacteria bacterium]|nr:FMN-binding protein [Actinomycetota bacterium]